MSSRCILHRRLSFWNIKLPFICPHAWLKFVAIQYSKLEIIFHQNFKAIRVLPSIIVQMSLIILDSSPLGKIGNIPFYSLKTFKVFSLSLWIWNFLIMCHRDLVRSFSWVLHRWAHLNWKYKFFNSGMSSCIILGILSSFPFTLFSFWNSCLLYIGPYGFYDYLFLLSFCLFCSVTILYLAKLLLTLLFHPLCLISESSWLFSTCSLTIAPCFLVRLSEGINNSFSEVFFGSLYGFHIPLFLTIFFSLSY